MEPCEEVEVDELVVKDRRFFGGRPTVGSGNQNVDIGSQIQRRRQRLARCRVQCIVGVLCKKENGHQITPASSLSLPTSSPTSDTITPALRVGGSMVSRTFNRGVTSTP